MWVWYKINWEKGIIKGKGSMTEITVMFQKLDSVWRWSSHEDREAACM